MTIAKKETIDNEDAISEKESEDSDTSSILTEEGLSNMIGDETRDKANMQEVS